MQRFIRKEDALNDQFERLNNTGLQISKVFDRVNRISGVKITAKSAYFTIEEQKVIDDECKLMNLNKNLVIGTSGKFYSDPYPPQWGGGGAAPPSTLRVIDHATAILPIPKISEMTISEKVEEEAKLRLEREMRIKAYAEQKQRESEEKQKEEEMKRGEKQLFEQAVLRRMNELRV